MSAKFDLEKRLTRKYNAGYSYLDEWEHVATAKNVYSKTRRASDESKRVFSLFLVSSKESESDVKQALRDTLSHRCTCEHDCCGHWQTDVCQVRRIKGGNLYAVVQEAYRNI
jgi:hypothetical protein